MKKKLRSRKPKRVLRLPDLDHSKTAVLNTLGSQESQRSYRFVIEDFIAWYCSEPRLAFNKTVVLRYRLQLEARHLSASTINVRLTAVLRLAYEAADSGLLSPELAASIRRVKGPKKLGVRLGNWLTATQGKELLSVPAASSVRGKRDFAMLALLLGCGLRRSELVHLTIEHLQRREDHWAIIDFSFEQLTADFQSLAAKLKDCRDPSERKPLLSEMRSIIGKLDHLTYGTSSPSSDHRLESKFAES